jgi:hypothetical protein
MSCQIETRQLDFGGRRAYLALRGRAGADCDFTRNVRLE